MQKTLRSGSTSGGNMLCLQPGESPARGKQCTHRPSQCFLVYSLDDDHFLPALFSLQKSCFETRNVEENGTQSRLSALAASGSFMRRGSTCEVFLAQPSLCQLGNSFCSVSFASRAVSIFRFNNARGLDFLKDVFAAPFLPERTRERRRRRRTIAEIVGQIRQVRQRPDLRKPL